MFSRKTSASCRSCLAPFDFCVEGENRNAQESAAAGAEPSCGTRRPAARHVSLPRSPHPLFPQVPFVERSIPLSSPIPSGNKGLTPHLVCGSCSEAIEFYKKAFGAAEIRRVDAPDGRRIMHAEISIGGQSVFLVDDFPEFCGGKSQTPIALGGTPVTIHRFVEDCDAAVKQAEQAGATVVMPPQDMFWGDRYGLVTDPFGHSWSLATHLRDLTPEEIQRGMREAFSQCAPA